MSIKQLKPPFVKTDQQKLYYDQLFDDLVANEIPLQTQDRFSLGILAINLCLIEEYAHDITQNGSSVEVSGDRGQSITKANPAVNGLKDAQNQVSKLLKEFKMTPSSRGAKVSSGGKEEADTDGFDAFMKNVRTK